MQRRRPEEQRRERERKKISPSTNNTKLEKRNICAANEPMKKYNNVSRAEWFWALEWVVKRILWDRLENGQSDVIVFVTLDAITPSKTLPR